MGSKRLLGMMLPGNGAFVVGSKIGTCTPPTVRPLKSPPYCAGVGTEYVLLKFRRCLNHSSFTRKNSLSLPLKSFGIITGPSISNPHWFHLKGLLAGGLPVKA